VDGLYTYQRLRCLRPILKEWIATNAELGREWAATNDAPWWYNERASVSVLAGAIWRKGEAAFEEYSELKRGAARLASGRFDLWFSCGRRDFWAEAKFCQVGFTAPRNQSRWLQWWMERAIADARRCPPDGSTRRLAIVFAAPYIRPRKSQEIAERASWLVQETRRLVQHDAMAWVFPNLSRFPHADGWVSPGAMVWIKEVCR
jgi:hypothetical protein